jgi:glutamate racemase
VNKRAIGVFDSGVGGLTVVREIFRVLPSEKIIYLGDTARVPWGTRGRKIIVDFSRQLTSFLLRKKVKVIVIACHTASSVAFPSLKKEIKIPLLGVIEPSLKEAIRKSKKDRIGLIGTPATVKANAWTKALKKESPKIKLFSASCPLFVPLVEEGLINHQATNILTKEYLQPLVKKRIDTLILGCTHYPLLQKNIKKVVGKVVLINPGKATASALKDYLIKNKLQAGHNQPTYQFYFTDVSYQALNNLEMFSGKLERVKIREVRLEK